MTPVMQAAALFKQFIPGDIVKSATLGLGVIPSRSLDLIFDQVYGFVRQDEVRFICLRDGNVYTHKDNMLTQMHAKIYVKEF